MDKQIEKAVEDQARLLRAASQIAGISSIESWEDIGTIRRKRWKIAAKEIISAGNILVPTEFVSVVGEIIQELLERNIQRENVLELDETMLSKVDQYSESIMKLTGEK